MQHLKCYPKGNRLSSCPHIKNTTPPSERHLQAQRETEKKRERETEKKRETHQATTCLQNKNRQKPKKKKTNLEPKKVTQKLGKTPEGSQTKCANGLTENGVDPRDPSRHKMLSISTWFGLGGPFITLFLQSSAADIFISAKRRQTNPRQNTQVPESPQFPRDWGSFPLQGHLRSKAHSINRGERHAHGRPTQPEAPKTC